MDSSPHNAYTWELEFFGETVKQASKPLGFDVQRPPRSLGQPKRIRLVPVWPDVPPVEIDIPDEGRPVCHRHITKDATLADCGVVWRVGWQWANTRCMVAIDPVTRLTRLVCDTEGAA